MAVIPPDLEPEILAKAGTGATMRQIAAWLKAEKGVVTSYGSVARILKRVRTERAEVSKAVLREQLSRTLTQDVDRLEKWAARIDRLALHDFEALENGGQFARMGAEGPIYVEGRETLVKLLEQLRKVTDTKLRYSGAAEPDPEGARRPVIMVPAESDD